MNHNYEYAKRLLSFYMRQAKESAGGYWSGDNQTEAEGIIDAIEQAVQQQINEALKKQGE